MKKYRYQAFGLTISSDLELPMLESAEKHSRTQIKIQQKNISQNKLKKAIKTGLWYQNSENEYKLSIPNLARFEVIQGKEINYDLDQSINPSFLTALPSFILNECMAFLLKQRGNLVFRGMAIHYKQQAIIFTGSSHTGKSLLAAKMQQKGYQVLCDEICAINSKNQLLIGYPYLKIWADCFRVLNIKDGTLAKVRPNIEKYYLPINRNKLDRKTLPVKTIYHTTIGDFDDEIVSIAPVKGVEKMVAIESLLYENDRYSLGNYNPSYSPRLVLFAKKTALNHIKRQRRVKLDLLTKTIKNSLCEQFENS